MSVIGHWIGARFEWGGDRIGISETKAFEKVVNVASWDMDTV